MQIKAEIFYRQIDILDVSMILLQKLLYWACSSLVECYVDIVEVASSILAMPTKFKWKDYLFTDL